MSAKIEALKPCPFCGSDKLNVSVYSNDGLLKFWTIRHPHSVACGVSLTDISVEGLTAKWNERK